MTSIDCKAIFNLQQQIIESTDLTAEQKLKMLLTSIKKTLGEDILGEIMTSEEFKSFKRSLANPAVRFKQGEISANELYEALFVVLGKETFDETKQLLAEAKKDMA